MPNFNLAGGANRDFQNALAMGMQMGTMARQAQDRRELKNALVAYDPANPDTLKPVMEANPEIGFRLRQEQQEEMARRQEAEQQAMQNRRADIPMLTRLLETATDEQTWQRNRGIAQQYGVDISGAPEQFDQGWRDQQLMTLKAISTPEGQEALSSAGKIAMDMGLRPGTPEFAQKVTEIWRSEQIKTVPYEAGGGIAAYNPTDGSVSPLVVPNYGTGQTPNTGIPQGAIDALRRGEGTAEQFDAMFGQGAAARILGGVGSNVGPTFLSGL